MPWPQLLLLSITLLLFIGMLLFQEFGRRLGAWRTALHPESARAGTGVIEAAVFGLLALLLGFQFAQASSRLDARRNFVVQESNAIGTAYLRLDLLRPESRDDLRDQFRRYVDARLRAQDVLPDVSAAEAAFAEAQGLQNGIWSRAVAACRHDEDTATTMLLLPALNDMIDITTTRGVAMRTHASAVIVGLLVCVCLLSAILAGYAMSAGPRRNLLYMLLFAGATAGTMFVILDMEYPRVGFIRIGAADQALRDVRQSMN